MTQEPLLEEYATASQMWKLSPTDLCEIARNSILQSGFTPKEKEEWIGPSHGVFDISGHDITKTNVPAIRLRFRLDSYLDEFSFVYQKDDSDFCFDSPCFEESS